MASSRAMGQMRTMVAMNAIWASIGRYFGISLFSAAVLSVHQPNARPRTMYHAMKPPTGIPQIMVPPVLLPVRGLSCGPSSVVPGQA